MMPQLYRLLVLNGFAASLAAQQPRGNLVVFNAAALGPPLRSAFQAFQRSAPELRLNQENSPSLDAVRKLTDFGKTPDLLAVADLVLLDSLVLPRYASWYLVFGSNALVLAYGPHSRYAADITSSNWWRILLRAGVRTGHSDARTDPSGYRTLMAAQLAEKFYQEPGLEQRLLSAMPARYQRRAEADLSALIQAGELDYIWTYRNLARAHRLRFVELPREVNLEDPGLAAWYAQATVQLPASPAGPSLVLRGAPIAFGLTIPKSALNRQAAESFVRFLLSAEGRRAMEQTGFEMLARPSVRGTGSPILVPR